MKTYQQKIENRFAAFIVTLSLFTVSAIYLTTPIEYWTKERLEILSFAGGIVSIILILMVGQILILKYTKDENITKETFRRN